MIDAYNNVAQIIKDAPSELQYWVDRNGTQAMRADLTARASQLIEASGAATAGTVGLAAWWASLSTAAAIAITAAGLSLLAGGSYLAFEAIRGGGHSVAQSSGQATAPAAVTRPAAKVDSNPLALKTRCDFKTDGEFIAWCSKAIDAYQKDCDTRLGGKPGWDSCTGRAPQVFKECYQWKYVEHPCQGTP